MNIALHSNILSERGACVALYDYAYYCREHLNLNPIIYYNLNCDNLESSVNHFRSQFEVIGYEQFSEVQNSIDRKAINYFYAIKYGNPDGVLVNGAKNLVHSVFSHDVNLRHGEVYAVVSEWQSIKSGGQIPFVPHMLNLPECETDLREYLKIPKDAVVIGRHGAYETFNINFVVDVILKTLQKRKDIWFLFLNTEKKIDHDRCIYMDKIIDQKEKVKFINTCDAMIHARDYGETFGLAVLEFAAKNKQIISYDEEVIQNVHPLGGRNHFLFLGNNCFRYQNENQLGYLLSNITRKNPFDTSYLVDKFSPCNVMNIFSKVFL